MEEEHNEVKLSTNNAPATESKTCEERIVQVQVESLPREERILNVQVEPNLDPRLIRPTSLRKVAHAAR